LKSAASIGRSWGEEYILLVVFEGNLKARNLYARHGYKNLLNKPFEPATLNRDAKLLMKLEQ